ncbi:MAG: fertility inhibition factor FiwA, partial [Pigmentiphaga sp.]
MIKKLRQHFAWRAELRSLAKLRAPAQEIVPDDSEPGILVWRLPVPGRPDVFMSLVDSLAYEDRFVVHVDAAMIR